MDLAAFRATGVDCADLGEALRDDCLAGSTGRLYLDSLYIERWEDGRNGIAPPNGPTWLLSLYGDQWDGDLLALEVILHAWAMNEGYGE
jgi:hypothetical protein